MGKFSRVENAMNLKQGDFLRNIFPSLKKTKKMCSIAPKPALQFRKENEMKLCMQMMWEKMNLRKQFFAKQAHFYRRLPPAPPTRPPSAPLINVTWKWELFLRHIITSVASVRKAKQKNIPHTILLHTSLVFCITKSSIPRLWWLKWKIAASFFYYCKMVLNVLKWTTPLSTPILTTKKTPKHTFGISRPPKFNHIAH